MSAAQRSASAMVLVGKTSRCGKIEKSTTPRVRSSGAEGHSTKYGPILGVSTMLPALTPTQTVSGSEDSSRPARTLASSGTGTSRRRRRPGARPPPGPREPSLRADGRQCGDLEETERRPAEAGGMPPYGLGGDESPRRCRTAAWVTPLCGRDTEGVALGDRLA